MVHVEVQGQVKRDFAERMYVYNYRIFDKHREKVVSLAVLSDKKRSWRPKSFGYELWGCKVSLEFPVVKLLDYEKKWSDLEQNDNYFAIIVMAHLKAQATSRDPNGRYQWKFTLIRMLYEKGFSRRDIQQLSRFIDWIMVLPEELECQFSEDMDRYEEGKRMRYVTSFERQGIRKGIQQGIIQQARLDVIEILEARFARVTPSLAEFINKLEDLSLLKILLKKAATVDSLEEFKQVVEGPGL